ncbi:MAG: hypothetical protein ACHQ52_03035 [Candidatus Eisenbacteria bacterium]
MRILRALPVLLFVAATMHAPTAAASGWSAGGMPISPSDSAADTPVVAPDGAGGVIVAWIDHRDTDWHFYVTRRTASGDVPTGWVGVGSALAGDTGLDPDIVSDGEGGAYVGWKYFGDVAIQHVTASGDIGGDWYRPNGANLPGRNALTASIGEASPAQIEHEMALHPQLVADPGVGVVGVYPNNGRFFNSAWVWKAYRPGAIVPPSNDAYGLVDPGSYDQQHPVACGDGSNGVLVAYVGNPGLQIRRYAEDGSAPANWPAGRGVTIHTGGEPAVLGICPDGDGGAFVVGADSDSGRFDRFSDLRLQHVRGDTTRAPGWPPDGILLTATRNEAGLVRGDDPWGGYQHEIVADGAGGAIVVWTDLRTDAGDVYALRVRGDGSLVPGWSTGGRAVAALHGVQHFGQVAADGAGGAYVAWVDTRDDPDGDLYAIHLASIGSPAPGWPAGGRLVAGGAGGIQNPRITGDGQGGAYVAWVDTRGPQPAIRLARLEPGGLTGVGAPIDPGAIGPSPIAVRPDPWRSDLAVAFTLDRARPVRIELLDVTGRRCALRELGTVDGGEHEVRIAPERTLPAGVYLVRVRAGDHAWTTRTVHVR